MADEERFPRLQAAAAVLGERTGDLTMGDLRALLCEDCEFYGDEHEDDLECSCFKMLRVLLVRGVLTPQRLASRLRAESDSDGE